jgi:hypothetical protein
MADAHNPAPDPAAALAEVFVATEPRPELREHLALFAPLIGSWSLIVHDFEPDGSVETTDAEWHFGWALDGRAVADVWLSPSRATREAGAPDGEWGLSVRFYDAALGAWRSTWIGPKRGWVVAFVGRRTDDGIELAGERDGTALVWRFSRLTVDSFVWQAEETQADGQPWVRQRFEATRSRLGAP